MNERLKELIEQATKVYEPDWNGGERLYEFDKEKFAELIVRECIKVIDDQPIFGSQPIKEHFGVEE